MQSHIHNFTFYPNFNWDRDCVFIFPNSNFSPIIPPSGSFIITETGDFIITEAGDRMITE
jgi:hypothetical protein